MQAKLLVGAVNDPLEHEADRVADQVMTMRHPAPAIAAAPPQLSRKCAKCQEEEHALLQAKSSGASPSGDFAPASVHATLATSGRTLDAPARGFLEPRFGRSFEGVRIHDDAQASQSAAAVGARAYTVGRHVVFGSSEYRPSEPAGMRLLAHELAHVAQQGGAGSRTTAANRSSDGVDAPAAAPALTPAVRRLQRYHHSNCVQSDLTNVIWPADGMAKQMVDKAIRVLSASPVNPAVTPLFTRYFMSATPSIPSILAVFRAIQAVFTGDSYTYECNNDCDDCAYVRARMRYIGLNPNIHICMNTIGAAGTQCYAYAMVHEMSHYSAHTSDNAYCHTGCCNTTSCPTSLTGTQALDNADSYGAFANDLYTMSV